MLKQLGSTSCTIGDARSSRFDPTRGHQGVVAMWVRQCDLDAEADGLPPIPSRIASNEEFVPPPQSAEQREYEARLAAITERSAQRHGRPPRRVPHRRQRD